MPSKGLVLLAELVIEQLGHFAGERTEVLSPVDAGKFVEQSGHDTSLSPPQHLVRARPLRTLAEPCAQLCGIFIAVDRITRPVPHSRGRSWRNHPMVRGHAELSVLGAVVGSTNRVVRPADSASTSPGFGVGVATPPLGRRRLHLDRASRNIATEHDPPRSGPSIRQMDAHGYSSLLAGPPRRRDNRTETALSRPVHALSTTVADETRRTIPTLPDSGSAAPKVNPHEALTVLSASLDLNQKGHLQASLVISTATPKSSAAGPE